MARQTNHTASPSTMNATTAAMIASSPSPPRPPAAAASGAGAWGPYASSRAFFSNVATILIILACVSMLAFTLHAAARFVLRCLARRRAARERRDGRAQQEPKLPSTVADAADAEAAAGRDGAAGLPSAGVWAEAECAICLSELAGGGRVRVLPACGHGFHAACVEGWLAARASCPTCRAPSRPSRAGEP